MKIGIVGTGNMGRNLGCRWALAGHEVFFGARKTGVAHEAADLARSEGARDVSYGSNDEAAAFGDVILYSPRGIMPSAVLDDATVLNGRTVLDLNNAIIPDGYAFEPVVRSLAEALQADVPGANVVKAFNTLAMEMFEQPKEVIADHSVSVFIAGDDEAACRAVAELAGDLGFTPLIFGGLRHARVLETAGDMIRYAIGELGMGPFAALSITTLPPVKTGRFGGRRRSEQDETHKAHHVSFTVDETIEGDLDAVWALVEDFDNVPNWHPQVADSKIENGSGREAGAIRAIHLADGTPLRETLRAISAQDRSYTYSVIEAPLPIENHRATVTFSNAGAGKVRVVWQTSLDVTGDAAPADIEEGVRTGVVAPGIEGFRAAVRKEAAS